MRSYKECINYDKEMGKKKRKKVEDKELCAHAVNCRRCRRCHQVPNFKLALWAKERSLPKGQSGVEGGILTTAPLDKNEIIKAESYKLPENTAVGHPNETVFGILTSAPLVKGKVIEAGEI